MESWVKLSSINLPNNLSQIGDEMFIQCFSLKKIVLPNNLIEIGQYAFSDSGITTLNLPSSLVIIGFKAFIGMSSLTEININNSSVYYSIDGVLFGHDKSLIHYPSAKNIEKYEVPNGTQSIKDSAFAYSKLITVTFPDSIKYIGSDVFFSSGGLSSISFSNDIVSIEDNSLNHLPNLRRVFIPKGKFTTFRKFVAFSELALIEI